MESVLASGVTRTGWLRGHAVNGVAGCVVLMVLFAASMGLTAGQAVAVTAPPVLALTVVCIGIGAAALVAIRRRDLALPA